MSKIWTLSLVILLSLDLSTEAQETNAFPSFVYHRFGDDRFPSTNIKIEQFEAHLDYLREENYEVITLSKALNKRASNQLKPKTVVLTIDDGYKSFYQNALPLLMKYGFEATLFVNTSTVGAPDFMTWDEIKNARNKGIEIGNHSHEHPYFLSSDIDFRADLMLSHMIFENKLGTVPKVYAYPYGEWNPKMARILALENYLGAAAQNSGIIGKHADAFALPRFAMSEVYAEINDYILKIKALPLEVTSQELANNGNIGSKDQPILTLQFEENELQLPQLQCFIQGSTCKKAIEVGKDQKVQLVLQPKTPLQQRRTLFTVTVQDGSGRWYWHSYSYVQPQIKP